MCFFKQRFPFFAQPKRIFTFYPRYVLFFTISLSIFPHFFSLTFSDPRPALAHFSASPCAPSQKDPFSTSFLYFPYRHAFLHMI